MKNLHHLFFPYTVFGNTNDFATYVTLFMPFAAYDLVIRLKGVLGWLAALGLCAAALFTLDNANSRACTFAVVLIISAFMVFTLFKRSLRKYVIPMFAVAMVLAIAAAAYLVRSGEFARMLRLLSMSDRSVSTRVELTWAAFKMLSVYHYMGVGIGNSVTLVPDYSVIQSPLNLHNTALQILTEYGVIIFVLLAAMLIGLAVRFLLHSAASRRDAVLGGLCFATICSFPLVGIASSDMTHLTPVWLLLGIWLACLRIFYPEEKNVLDRIIGSIRVRRFKGLNGE